MQKILDFLNYKISLGQEASISVQNILLVLFILLITAYILKLIRNLVTRKLPFNDKAKFVSVFNYLKWLAYVIIFLVTLHTSGINVTAVFAASAALLIGVGLALQTLFQDIISGIFILVDQTVHAGDIIELEGKIGRVEEINLRTTRAVTIDNKVMIIPNHLYLTNTLYNWTANGEETRESVEVGVAYGSDVQLVKELLLEAVNNHSSVLKSTKAHVFFSDFGESALNFRVAFSLNNSFEVKVVQSELRFEIDRLFREHKIKIPFPQRDIHIIDK
jgi:small-conductance mechanosensitive channel